MLEGGSLDALIERVRFAAPELRLFQPTEAFNEYMISVNTLEALQPAQRC